MPYIILKASNIRYIFISIIATANTDNEDDDDDDDDDDDTFRLCLPSCILIYSFTSCDKQKNCGWLFVDN